MNKTFLIAGSIVDTDADRETFEDVTPAQVNSFLMVHNPWTMTMGAVLTGYGQA